MAAGYSVRVVVDTASLVAAGKLRADGNDLRVVWENGATPVELDRVAESAFNSAATEIWFRTQAAIPSGGQDGNYSLYYGNATAGVPPANAANVYALWDDFAGTVLDTSRWSVANGTVSVSGGQVRVNAGAAIVSTGVYTYSVLEMRMQMVTANNWGWWGWEDSPVNESNYVVFEETPGSFGAFARANNGAPTDQYMSDPAGGLTVAHTYRINWLAGNLGWQIDNTGVANSVTNVPTVPMRAIFYGYSVPLSVDWVKIRPYISPEPVVTLSGGN